MTAMTFTTRETIDEFRVKLEKVNYKAQNALNDCENVEYARAALTSLGFANIVEMPVTQALEAINTMAEYPHRWREWTFLTCKLTTVVAFTETTDGVLFQLLR